MSSLLLGSFRVANVVTTSLNVGTSVDPAAGLADPLDAAFVFEVICGTESRDGYDEGKWRLLCRVR